MLQYRWPPGGAFNDRLRLDADFGLLEVQWLMARTGKKPDQCLGHFLYSRWAVCDTGVSAAGRARINRTASHHYLPR